MKPRLQTIPGVGRAEILGERRYAMRVWLSANELAARGPHGAGREAAIRTRNVEVPAGRIESDRREFTVRSLGELKTPEEFEDLVVSNRWRPDVRLRDLGRVELGPENERSAIRFNGIPPSAWASCASPRPTSWIVADAIRAAVPAIQAAAAAGGGA